MTDTHVRSATLEDLPRLTDLWLEQQTITQQLDPRLVHSAPATEDWRTAAEQDLSGTSQDVTYLVVERDGVVLGFVVVAARADRHSGRILEMVIDAHKGQGGLGTLLLQAALDWLRQRSISHVIVDDVPRNHAVQQAFWRAKGAKPLQETFYLRLKDDK